MSNRTSLRMRVLPRFPARLVGANGLQVDQDNLDLVIGPDFGALTTVPAVDNPLTTYFWAWESSQDTYSRISFQSIVSNIQDVIIGPTTAAMEATSPGANQFIYFTGTDVAAVTGLTAAGRALLGDADAAAQRTTLGLGTAALNNTGDFATAGQGALADTAVQPARTISVGIGLTGGGNLSADRSIALNAASIASLALADTSTQAVATLAALKAKVPYTGMSIDRNTGVSSGPFAWQTGDFTAHIAADPDGAIFVKANTIATTVGAFVRQSLWPTTGVCAEWCSTLTNAVNLAAFIGVKITYGVGSYTMSAAFNPPVGSIIDGRKQMIIKQANAANLSETVLLNNNCVLKDIVFDGNAANNTASPASRVLIRIGNANDCVIEGCVIDSIQEIAVAINAGLRAKIRYNKITNARDFAVFGFGTAFAEAYHMVHDNDISGMGWAPFFFQWCDGVSVFNNKCQGNHIGGRGARITANASGGNTVTWVSGPQFTTVRVGNFVLANGGGEYRVLAVNSATSLTVAPDALGVNIPNLSGVQISVGSGDLCGITASSFFQVRNNIFKDTATFGCGSSLGSTAVQCGNGFFSNNQIINPGKNGICISQFGGLGITENISISNNKIFNAGYGAGIATNDRIGILISGSVVQNCNITDNTILSYTDAGNPGQTTFWLGFEGGQQPFGSCSVSGNRCVDLVNATVFDDIKTAGITLTGWGTGAATSGILSYGNTIQFNITAGTTPSANPSILVNKIICSGNQVPLPKATMVTTSVAPTGLNMFYGEQTSTRGFWRATMAGTPTVAVVYTVVMTLVF